MEPASTLQELIQLVASHPFSLQESRLDKSVLAVIDCDLEHREGLMPLFYIDLGK